MKQVDEGIFLHRTNYSESSLIITFFTRNSGIQKFIFKGGKKKAHNLYPMSVAELTFFGRQDSELLTLTQADSITLNVAPFDPVRSTIAFFMAELIRKGLRESDKDEAGYNYLIGQIQELHTTKQVQLLPLSFLIGFTDFIGIKPLESGEQDLFDLKEGTFGSAISEPEYVASGDRIALIRNILKEEKESNWNREIRTQAFETMLRYYAFHIPNMDEISSLEIIRQVLYD